MPDVTQDGKDRSGEQWVVFRDAVYSTAFEHLGPATRRNQDWFDENDKEIQALLLEKHKLPRAHQNDPSSQMKKDAFASTRCKVTKDLREMQDSWYSRKAEEIQSYANSHDTGPSY